MSERLVRLIAVKNEVDALKAIYKIPLHDQGWYNFGYSALFWACKNGLESVALELIPRTPDELINKWHWRGNTILLIACDNKLEKVALELIPRMSVEAINHPNDDNKTALSIACSNSMFLVVSCIEDRLKQTIPSNVTPTGLPLSYPEPTDTETLIKEIKQLLSGLGQE